MKKTCTVCGIVKSLEKFNRDASTSDGRRTWCKLCSRDKDRAYRYNMPVEEFRSLLRAQGYSCAVCGEMFGTDKAPDVDHDHLCCPGRVGCGRCNRGLVCARCNKVLGLFEDDVTLFEAATKYLTRGDTIET